MVELKLEHVTKRYDDAQGTEMAVDDLSLTTEDELIVLLGPSGCGKTTTLRMIAGLESVTDGRISINGRDVTSRHPSDRSIAMVFQDYGLYTTMSVAENIGYGLKHSTDLSASERQERVAEMAALFDIEELLNRDVTDLSGGQKQRVALGRAMVRDPDVFLLDEPLASLDAKLRSEMRTELQRLQAEMDITTVYVTHNQKEAMTMADRIAVLNDGALQQAAQPEVIYNDPKNRFVANFLGNPPMNQLPATVVEEGPELHALHWEGERDDTSLTTVPQTNNGVSAGDTVIVGLRPEALSVTPLPTDQEGFDATVAVTEYQGNDNFVHLRLGDRELTAVVLPTTRPVHGDRVRVSIDPSDVFLFDPSTGQTLRSPGQSEAGTLLQSR